MTNEQAPMTNKGKCVGQFIGHWDLVIDPLNSSNDRFTA
jgi:hypothetical protein